MRVALGDDPMLLEVCERTRIDGESDADVASDLGVSRSWISQLRKKAEGLPRGHVDGIDWASVRGTHRSPAALEPWRATSLKSVALITVRV